MGQMPILSKLRSRKEVLVVRDEEEEEVTIDDDTLYGKN
jgi:hypothetical protein